MYHNIFMLLKTLIRSSSPGEFHPQALTDRYVTVSRHTAPASIPLETSRSQADTKRTRLLPRFSGVDHRLLRADSSPSLQPHYRTFNTTTGCSAPASRLGTLTLVGPPLAFLPSHRDDRFPRSAPKPGSSSCHLYAGRRPDNKQAPSGLILQASKYPQF